MSRLLRCTSLLALLAFSSPALADESDEIRERVKAMRRESEELNEQGHRDEAANLEREADALMDEAARRDREDFEERERIGDREQLERREREIDELRGRLGELHQRSEEIRQRGGEKDLLLKLRREAERIERELHARSEGNGLPRRPEPGRPESDAPRRLEHMRIAIEHLRQAGLPDIAEHVAQRAEETERALHHGGPRPPHEGQVLREVMEQLEQLRHEVERLHAEIREMRERR